MKLKIILSVIFATIIFVVLMLLCETLVFQSEILPNSVSTPVRFVIYGFLSLALTVIIVYAFCYFLKDNVRILGLKGRKWHSNFIKGALTGIFCIIVGLSIIYIFGNINIQKTPARWSFISTYFLMAVFLAISEELFFRGFLQNQFTKIAKPFWAIIFTSLIFVVLHGSNSDVTLISLINIFVISIFLGFSFYGTKNLYFPIGFHIFWNVTQAFFGFSVSGDAVPSFFEITYKNENIINGGNFGFEGSIICTIIILVLITFMIVRKFLHK